MNPSKDVARLASEIVAKWKKIVTAEQEASKKRKMAGSSPPKAQSPAVANEVQSFTGDVAKRRWEHEKVDIKRTGYPTRDACIGLLYNGLAFMSNEASIHVVIKAMEVEQAAFDTFKGETPEYKSKLRSLYQNLKAISNRELGPRVMSGEIPAAQFVIMSHEELKSAERRKEDEKLEQENMKKAQVPMQQKSISDALRCGKCGQKKVSYTQAQTRSADEPMTTFCECTVCGNRWKVRCLSSLCWQLLTQYSFLESSECLAIVTLLGRMTSMFKLNFSSSCFADISFSISDSNFLLSELAIYNIR